MDSKSNKLIFTAYKDENNNIHLGVSPELEGFTNGKEYFINLGDSLLKMSIEKILRLDSPSKEGEDN